MKTVLLTGATGDVGSHLRRELKTKYNLRLSDKRPLENKSKDEKFIRADISKMSDALKITKGVDAIIHLGGYSLGASRLPGKHGRLRESRAALRVGSRAK